MHPQSFAGKLGWSLSAIYRVKNKNWTPVKRIGRFSQNRFQKEAAKARLAKREIDNIEKGIPIRRPSPKKKRQELKPQEIVVNVVLKEVKNRVFTNRLQESRGYR